MKNRSALLCLLLSLAWIMCGCGNQSTGETIAPSASPQESTAPESPSDKDGTIADYFPVRDNAEYIYAGAGNEYASYSVYTEYTAGSRIQQRILNGGTETVKVIEIKDGAATCIFRQDETYYRENLIDKDSNVSDILLMEPIKAGTSWKLNDGNDRSITNLSAKVETPSGTYSAIAVETENEYGKITDYYAKGVGLVKTVSSGKDYEISSSLSEIKENTPFVQSVRFYYPSVNDSKLYYKVKEVSFNTNDVTRKVLEEAYKESFEGQPARVFSENTKINSLYLNSDGMVYIDLSREFITEMNAGAGYEAMILQCVANTFASYYGQNKVLLTIDGELYESGHILLKAGEYLSAAPDEGTELK